MTRKQRDLIRATVTAQAREAARTAGVPITQVRTMASADMWSILFPFWDEAKNSYLSPVEDEGCYAVSFVPREP